MTGNTILGRLSYHAVYDESVLSALQYAHENGFHGIQLADEVPHLSFERLTVREKKDIAGYIGKTGLKLSLHALDEAVSLFITSPSLRKGIKSYFQKLTDFAVMTGAQVLTIHLGSPVMFRPDTNPEEPFPPQDLPLYCECLISSLEYLVSLTHGKIALCVENYRLEEDTLKTIEPYLSDGRLFLCWDIAKSRNDPGLEEYFKNHIGLVKQVHLHDYWERGGKRRSHRAVGSGVIDFRRYLPLFKEADILDFCIEVRPREKALESLVSFQQMVSEGK